MKREFFAVFIYYREGADYELSEGRARDEGAARAWAREEVRFLKVIGADVLSVTIERTTRTLVPVEDL